MKTEPNNQELIINLKDEFATRKLGENLARLLLPNSVVLLTGNLGAGKTTLIQGLGLGLGITESIVSPTFTLINEYLEGKIPLYHIDIYRLNSQQIKQLHLENYWQGMEVEAGITAIEWGNLLPSFPPQYLEINLIFVEDNETRKAIIKSHNIELKNLTKILDKSNIKI